MKGVVTRDSLNDGGWTELDPFHGDTEQVAMLCTWITLVLAVCVLLFPWLLAGIVEVHHPDRSFRSALPMSITWLSFLDVLGLVPMWSYYTLYRRLSARIAAGGSDAAFLDKVRFQVATLVQSLMTLLILILMRLAK
jgi:hypothetical protein